MRTAQDNVIIVWKKINDSALSTEISGGVYKGSRPVNSVSEDIVVNTLGLPNQQVQQSIINVNIHVPNKDARIDGVINSVCDDERLNELTRMALELLNEDYSGDDWHFEVQQHTQPVEQEGSYYVNIRIEFYSLNIQ
jgi:hypothetical protein